MNINELIRELMCIAPILEPGTPVEAVEEHTGQGYRIKKVVQLADENRLRLVVEDEQNDATH